MTNQFNERLSELLKAYGYTQKAFSQEIGVTEAAMSHYIKGDRVPRAAILLKMAEVLGATTEDLVGVEKTNVEGEIHVAKRLIARNVHQMTKKQKMEIIGILMSDE